MSTSRSAIISKALERLSSINAVTNEFYRGDSGARQPVHVVYGGAQLFKATTAKKMGELSIAALKEAAPNFSAFGRALQLGGWETLPTAYSEISALEHVFARDTATLKRHNYPAWFAATVYERVLSKLEGEAVEDFRIDFEDGYGNRPDEEEDAQCGIAAKEVAVGMREGILPPFIGIRIKPFSEERKRRSLRTLELFLSALVKETGGKLPTNFVVTLPKITDPGQMDVLAEVLDALEVQLGLPSGAVKIEAMIESPQSLFLQGGDFVIPKIAAAARGRMVGAHFGTYDYTASCSITAKFQAMDHGVCDVARNLMKIGLAGTGIFISDGATNVMPVGPHKKPPTGELSHEQIDENRAVIHRAWRLSYGHIRHSLKNGFYQGWDLHPAQLPIRYAALNAFFLEQVEESKARLTNFIEQAAKATLVGDIFDDAATGQGLLNFFLLGISCGAVAESELLACGLTQAEIRSRSFYKILEGRRKG